MADGNDLVKTGMATGRHARFDEGDSPGLLHPAWSSFVRYCQELRHGEIECLKIQDGLPILAEVTKKKVKFA